jgi:catalase
MNMAKALEAAGALPKLIAPRGGTLLGAKGKELKVDFSLLTTSSVLFDAVYVPGGAQSVAALRRDADAVHFINEAYKHCKAIAATGEGVELLLASYVASELQDQEGSAKTTATANGLVVDASADARKVADTFIAAIAEHRYWVREQKGDVPA